MQNRTPQARKSRDSFGLMAFKAKLRFLQKSAERYNLLQKFKPLPCAVMCHSTRRGGKQHKVRVKALHKS